MMNLISLGAGVQSSTMALMAAAGEITPMPDGAIFADTQDEPKSVYVWLDWLEKQLPFPVHRVTAGSLSKKVLQVRTSSVTGRRFSSCSVPVYTLNSDGPGQVQTRGCTRDFKIIPLTKCTRRLAGIKRGQKTVGVHQWIGISLDEVVRMKKSREAWIENRWPLVEMRMRRNDCLRWMRDHGHPTPPRSACVYCPFHSNAEWRRIKTEDPEGFSKAVQFEKDLQGLRETKDNAIKSKVFLHRSCLPLSDIDLSTDLERGQSAWWEDEFRDECEGMCGV